MNQVVKHEPKAALVAGGDVAAIIPRTIEETFRLANALSASGLAPNTLNTPDKVMVAIIAGAELGLPPFQALQSFAVINGRPALWGDGLMGVVRSNGFRVREWLEGEGETLTAHCEVTRPDNAEVIARSFSTGDAKVAGLWKKAGPWTSNPKRMLQMRARAFALRDGAADVLRGFQIREEVEDYQPIRQANAPQPTGLRARLAGGDAEREGFSAARAAEDAEAIEAEVEELSVESRLGGDDLPANLKTGRQLQAEQEAAGAAQTGAGPDTLAEDESAAHDADFEPVAQSDDEFPGDKPIKSSQADQGAGGAKNPAGDGPAPPPAYIFEDAAEFASAAPADLEGVGSVEDLKTLWLQWTPEIARLRKADKAACDTIVALKDARKAELEREAAR